MSSLFEPLRAGDLTLRNRIVMAPLTRQRANEGRVPSDLMVEYYSQRADAGMILTEATSVTPQGVGYADTPGLWSTEQVKGWRKVTSAVHAKDGLIVAQLWHVGRISDPIFLNGEPPVAPSAIAAGGHVSLVRPKRPYVTPRALETAEIPGVVEAYRHGAKMAQESGFDGVEVHAANGYLLDQFLQDSTNLRTDQYGGSLENARACCWKWWMRASKCGAPGAWAYTCRRAAIRTRWAIRIRRRPSPMWRPNWANAASRSFAHANMKAKTAWGRS